MAEQILNAECQPYSEKKQWFLGCVWKRLIDFLPTKFWKCHQPYSGNWIKTGWLCLPLKFWKKCGGLDGVAGRD